MLLPLVLLSALQAAPRPAAEPAAPADSLSGTGQISLDLMGNASDQTCTIEQTGASLGGSVTAKPAPSRR